jgi:magnesium-transporting ATPase (P-type)
VSHSLEKTSSPARSKEASISKRTNYLFMGTSIVSGTATAVVVKTSISE